MALYYFRECPDDTVAVWTASGHPVWMFASLRDAIEASRDWPDDGDAADPDGWPERPGAVS
jgi:hypothetical protein